jgi:predicted RNase H-like HicB family nuclease
MTMRYLVVYEKGPTSFSAYSPDLPGCVAAGTTLEETRENIRGAIEMHLSGLREDGLPVPEGRAADEAEAEIVEVA